jgi:plastocyanin
MRIRIHTASIFTLSLGTTLLWACGGGEGGGEAGGEAEAEGGAMEQEAAPAVDPSTAGNVTGMVMLTGTPPQMEPIDMGEEPTCAEKHTSPPMTQEVVSADGHLANVFVYVKEGLEGMQFPAPSEATVIDQDGCTYVPHVSGVMVGQDLTFRNSDGLLHNINATPSENRGFNISQPVEMETSRTFSAPEVMVPIRCDVHGWMSAYVGVLTHPYFAVSGEDGTFDLSTLPPGDYVLEAWHERYGTQTANVTVVTGQTAQASFTFDASATALVPMGEPIDPHDHGTPGTAVAAGGER